MKQNMEMRRETKREMKVDMAACLEYEKVKEGLMEYAKSYLGREHIRGLMPITDQVMIERWLEESAEAVKLIEHGASVPVPALDGMEPLAAGLGKGFLLTVSELGVIVKFLENTVQLKRFMGRKESIAPQVTSYALSLYELSEVRLEIERCIRHGAIDDGASPELAKVRKKMVIAEERLKEAGEHHAALSQLFAGTGDQHARRPLRHPGKEGAPQARRRIRAG